MSDAVEYTFAHFERIAEENRFPENASIEHDSNMCLICHPENIPGDSFKFCLDLIVSCILKRRPRIDESLIEAVNEEMEMLGEDYRITLQELLNEEPEAVKAWQMWARSSINTGLEMLSMHSQNAPYYQLDDLDESRSQYVRQKLEEFFRLQKGTSTT
ncbi:hypothetical protein [Thermodesulforhabdus norvegica]|uniref:Uncharacterized protein n=1 Tax=Thermodesulforhabdus norvegica TaxID=39841 RepID=A0A1I4UWJ9_9BACT|nr:hypothetical protein [Thermodesulforhabdus norvegica]SFM93352.1 hypothetical protein SAMN05660836_02011 [Thermodesulforhabdus norvegica]